MFCRNRNIAAVFNTLRLHHRLVCALQIAGGHQEGFIHRACASRQSQIGRLHVFNTGGLHLDFEVLQWSKLVEIGRAQNETKPNPQLIVCTSHADSYSSSRRGRAPHKKKQTPKFRDVPDGVYDGVGCSRLQW